MSITLELPLAISNIIPCNLNDLRRFYINRSLNKE